MDESTTATTASTQDDEQGEKAEEEQAAAANGVYTATLAPAPVPAPDSESIQPLIQELRDMLRNAERVLPPLALAIVAQQRQAAISLAELLKQDPLLILPRVKLLGERIRGFEETMRLVEGCEGTVKMMQSLPLAREAMAADSEQGPERGRGEDGEGDLREA